ncbi:MAG: ligase-associated DNA damage response endonuclease PdeM [Steroidobacteraceae bacterium]
MSLAIDWAGEELLLSAQRAVIWPARRMLLVADTHFGKVGVFQRAGMPVPEGIDAHDLTRLSELIEAHAIQRLVVLGDFLHGPPAASGVFFGRFEAWLERHPALLIDIVTGNHDRHGGAGLWPRRIRWHDGPLHEPPFTLVHQDEPSPGAGSPARPHLCGHLHPVLSLSSASGDHARLPAFWFTESRAVLPAFGRFTGGASIRAARGDRVFVIAEEAVLPVPTA